MDRYNGKEAVRVANRLLLIVITMLIPLLFMALLLGCAQKSPIPKIDYKPVFVEGNVDYTYKCVNNGVYNAENQCLQDCTKEFGDHVLNMDFRSFVPYAECLDAQKDFYKNHIKRLESKINITNKQIEEMR